MMSPNANLAYYALWFAHPVLEAGLAGILIWRKLYRTFPIFFAYVAFQIPVFGLLFSMRGERFYTIFYYSSWSTTAISVVLGFFVIHELFQDVFRPYHTLRDLGSVLFKWALLVMLLVAGVVAASDGFSDGRASAHGNYDAAAKRARGAMRVDSVSAGLFTLPRHQLAPKKFWYRARLRGIRQRRTGPGCDQCRDRQRL